MILEKEIAINPADIGKKENILHLLSAEFNIPQDEITGFVLLKRSVDARSRYPVFRERYRVYCGEPVTVNKFIPVYKPAESSRKVIIVGSGPAGMFAALRLIELGIKPVILERGKDVRERRRDLRAIQQEGLISSESNYCFGEGGAGTYSDGKLYTRSTKRGDVGRILSILNYHGASEDILVDAHPHIGSNKLPKIVSSIRETILNCGGEYLFDSKVTSLIKSNNKITGVIVNNEKEFLGDAVILATGHSARDIYYMLNEEKIRLEAKAFAVGVRIEHPQPLIDFIQYKSKVRHINLPAASYSLNHQAAGRGVYSFCMCPGGIIVPASTAPGELVLNGMSVSKRNSPYANAGIVVEVKPEDLEGFSGYGVFAGLEFQKQIEKDCFTFSGGTQKAPSQRADDFLKGKLTSKLNDTSYIPGIVTARLDELLPKGIVSRLKEGLNVFDKKMTGFASSEAQMLAPETRTSSPIRIPRNGETFMHPGLMGLFPAGEGAGYAGGIVSAAIDGENCANSAAAYIS